VLEIADLNTCKKSRTECARFPECTTCSGCRDLRLIIDCRDALSRSWLAEILGERQRFAIGVGGLLELALFSAPSPGRNSQGIRRSLYSFFVCTIASSYLLVLQEPAESYAMASALGSRATDFGILLRIGQRPLPNFSTQIVVDLAEVRASPDSAALPIIKFGFVEFLCCRLMVPISKSAVGRVNLGERVRCSSAASMRPWL